MSYFSRLAFDLMQLLEGGQVFEAQQRLFAEGCKNPNPQIQALQKIAQEHHSKPASGKYFPRTEVKSYRSRIRQSQKTRLKKKTIRRTIDIPIGD